MIRIVLSVAVSSVSRSSTFCSSVRGTEACRPYHAPSGTHGSRSPWDPPAPGGRREASCKTVHRPQRRRPSLPDRAPPRLHAGRTLFHRHSVQQQAPGQGSRCRPRLHADRHVLNTVAILVAGWTSNNKYSLFGAIRSVAQSVAYEIRCFCRFSPWSSWPNAKHERDRPRPKGRVCMSLSSRSPSHLLRSRNGQTNPRPSTFRGGDELTAGSPLPNTSGWFSMFSSRNTRNMFFVCSLAVVFFSGAGPVHRSPIWIILGSSGFPSKGLPSSVRHDLDRWDIPEVRSISFSNFCWMYLLPFSLVNLLLTA